MKDVPTLSHLLSSRQQGIDTLATNVEGWSQLNNDQHDRNVVEDHNYYHYYVTLYVHNDNNNVPLLKMFDVRVEVVQIGLNVSAFYVLVCDSYRVYNFFSSPHF